MLIVCITRPNLSTKAGYIALISLPESKSADTASSAEPSWVTSPGKAIRYWIYVTHFSSLTFTRIAFLLSSVINVEIVKTNASFLALSQGTCWYNGLFAYKYSTQCWRSLFCPYLCPYLS